MIISHQLSERKGAFIAMENNEQIGEMTYSKLGDNRIIIDHTQVDIEQKGKGIGNQLLNKVVDMARAENLKIIPLCPFAAAVFSKNEDISDVLSK